MHRSAQEHRQEFAELGYTVFEGVLSQEEIDYALPIFDDIITIETQPPVVVTTAHARRQLNSAFYCEPRLSNFGGHPYMLEAVEMLMGPYFYLMRSPVPCVTFPGEAGGAIGPDWQGHVDWWNTPPVGPEAQFIYGLVHFTTVESGGGGFTVVPGSHQKVMQGLQDPEISQHMFEQQFKDFPSLQPPQEICAGAGDVLFYHAMLVHGASDNQSEQPRKILFTHYMPPLETEMKRRIGVDQPGFHPDHVAVMDERFRRLCGL